MKKFKIYTLGCKVNQYESEAIKRLFINEGYRVADKGETADVCVINTCTVTGVSDKKSRQVIRRAKRDNPDAVIAVIGCLAQVSSKQVAEMDEVDIVLGTANKSEIIKAVSQKEKYIHIVKSRDFEPLCIDTFSERTRAFIKIQDGCDNFCSYCIIPYARGAVRSRDSKEICEEINRLADNGFCEFVLTGIHVASYGRGGDTGLADLIDMVSQSGKVKRIRLSSIDPMAFSDSFINQISQNKKLCPHFHLSLQSGSDKILKLMNRKYTTDIYAETVAKIRSNIKNTAITTDVITGFPGEDEDEFLKTVEFVQKININGIHVFPYSERHGTKAAEMDGRVDVFVREERARRLIEVAARLRFQYVRQFVGTPTEVLWEQKTHDGYISGFTPNYIKFTAPKGMFEEGTITSVTASGEKNGELFI